MPNHKYQFVETREKFFWFPCLVEDCATQKKHWRWLVTRTVAVRTSESECLEAPGLLSYAYFENYDGPTHDEYMFEFSAKVNAAHQATLEAVRANREQLDSLIAKLAHETPKHTNQCKDYLSVTESQYAKALVWMEAQDAKSDCCGTIGGRYTFEITPTSIGIAVSISDCVLNEKLDLTDYDSW